jgi:predicted DNA-binding transcriptional regulator AlpA
MNEARCYTLPEVLQKLQMAKTTFNTLKRTGRLPFLEELRPRLGRRVRYRADLIDQYLRGEWKPFPSLAFGRRRTQ